jgi:hypothetical protein
MSDFVPREFVGRARQFRDRVLIADKAVKSFLETVRARRIARRRHSPVEQPDVSIDELRAGESIGQLSSWGPDAEQEREIGVIRMTFHIERVIWKFDAVPLAIVSLHAIARRMQRGIISYERSCACMENYNAGIRMHNFECGPKKEINQH